MANPYEVQLEGVMEFATVDDTGAAGGFVDYSDELASLVMSITRDTVDRKPTYADARTIKRAAGLVEAMTVNYLGDETNAAGFWGLIWDALHTPPCNLAFRAVYRPGLVSADNPMFTGFVTPIDMDAGAPAGESKYQSKTWPAFGVEKVIVAPAP